MRAFIIFSLLSLFVLNLPAQGKLNQVDDQGRKTGKWVDYHPNGKKRYEGTFKDGYEVDTFRFYNGLGQLISELVYSEKGSYAQAKMFYSDGSIKAEGRFHNKKKDGLWKYYTNTPHRLKKEESYKDGVKDGRWRVYYTGGQLTSEIYWKNGKRDGPWREYFENGEPRIEAEFKDGELTGQFIVYYEGLVIAKQGHYVNGKMDGIWYFYNDKGELTGKERYSNGFLQEKAVFENGRLVSDVKFTTTKFNDNFKDPEADGE